MTGSSALEILNLCSFFWLFFWALFVVCQMVKGSLRPVLWVIIVHFVVCGIPLFLDLIIGVPIYGDKYGFYYASRDVITSIIYDLYVCICPPLWWFFGRPKRYRESQKAIIISWESIIYKKYTYLLLIILLLPLVLISTVPEPNILLEYGYVTKRFQLLLTGSEWTYLREAASISLICAFIIINLSKRRVYFILCFVMILVDVWVVSKRYTIAMAIFLTITTLWNKGYLSKARILLVVVAAPILMGVFSYAYQSSVRGINLRSSSFEGLYEDVRIDYGRDDVIKLAIYSEVHPEAVRILEHRGQSFLFYLTMYIPRRMWPEKPLPYEQYINSAVHLSPPQMLGWGITTSMLAETISNFGWVGMLIGPMVIIIICRLSQATGSRLVTMLGSLVAILFLMVQLSAFVVLFAMWLFLSLCAFYGKRKLARRARNVYQGGTFSKEASHTVLAQV